LVNGDMKRHSPADSSPSSPSNSIDSPELTRSTTFDNPGSELAMPSKSGDYRPQVSWKYCISNHVLTTFHHPSHHVFTSRFFASVVFQLPEISADKPNKAKKEPEIHHNSPQTPKTRFTRSKVVRPQLIDFTPREENLLP